MSVFNDSEQSFVINHIKKKSFVINLPFLYLVALRNYSSSKRGLTSTFLYSLYNLRGCQC